MSSIELSVITYIKAKIAGISGAPIESKHHYDLNKNDGVRNDFIFAIRSGSGRPVSGTVGRATMEQSFEVEFSRDYIEGADSDEALRDAIEAIRAKFDSLIMTMVGKPSGNILFVGVPTFDSPVVSQAGNSVSITYTFPITYYVSTRGA